MADPFVTTEWLAVALAEKRQGLRIVDGSSTMLGVTPTARETYERGHLPDAVFFDINLIADQDTTLPHMLPPADEFAQAVEGLGISNDDTVVVYDAGNYMGGPRVWWTFRTFGHRAVYMLDGGVKKWTAEGRPLDAGVVAPPRGRYRAQFDARRVHALRAVRANIASRAAQLVDARSRERFEGTADEPWPGRRRGRVPGSFNVPYTLLFDPDTGVFADADRLAAVFAEAGVDITKPTITTCGSGVTAATVTLALARLGHEANAIYDGSWAEWGLPGGPDEIKTGPRSAERP